MSMFLSYTHSDEPQARALAADLSRLGRNIWHDHKIHGGTLWWGEVVQQIQSADVFLLALSDASLQSRYCRHERRYAEQLGIPIVPVQVGEVANLKIPEASRHIVDYRERNADVVIELVEALIEIASRPRVRPHPMPPPPEMPFQHLVQLAEEINAEEISPRTQVRLIAELRQELRTETDVVARKDVLTLLRTLRARSDITLPNAEDIDAALRDTSAVAISAIEVTATRLPPPDQLRKQRDGARADERPTEVLDTGGGATERPGSATPSRESGQAEPGSGQAGRGSNQTQQGSDQAQREADQAEWGSDRAERGADRPERESRQADAADVPAWLRARGGGPDSEQQDQERPGPHRRGPQHPEPGSDRGTSGAAAPTGATATATSDLPRWLLDRRAARESAAAEPRRADGATEWWSASAAESTAGDGREEPAAGSASTTATSAAATSATSTTTATATAGGGAPTPTRVSRFALLGSLLGALGIPFLLLGPLALLAPGPSAGPTATFLILLGILAVSMSVVAAARREPGGRTASLISVLGLVGVITFAVVTHAFG